MKKIFCFLFAIIMALCLSACASPQSVTPPKIMLILQPWSGSFAEDVTRGANAAANKYGYEVTVKNIIGQDAARQQADLIRSAAGQGFSAVIVDPADSETVGKAAGEAGAHGVTVISVNSGIQAGQNCTVDIDKDQMAAGAFLLAQGLAGEDTSVLVLNCLDEYDNTQRLADALQSKLKEFPDIKLSKIDFHIGDNAKLTDNWREFTASARGGVAVIALNGYATVFASNELKTITEQKTALISFSNDKNTIRLLEQKRVDAICINRNVNIGFTAVEQASRVIAGNKAQNVLIPSVFVNLQNLYSSEIQQTLFPIA